MAPHQACSVANPTTPEFSPDSDLRPINVPNLSNRSGCPSCEGDGEDEDCEAHTMETGAEYEMKVLKGESSTSTNNDCHTKGQGQVQPYLKDKHSWQESHNFSIFEHKSVY